MPELADDFAQPFQIEHRPVRGRIVRLGDTVHDILSRHAYPGPVANLLGEACALAALVGASLKFEGRLILQAQGDGPVSLVVVDYDTAGTLRGYCKFDAERVAALKTGFLRPGAKALLGEGLFLMTVDQGADMERYQGVTPIEGETLALSAERYFAQSEQIPTRVRLAVGEVDIGDGPNWRAGGLLIQNIAGDSDSREETAEAWSRSQIFFETVGEDELIDPTIGAPTLLWRLFNEDGVRLFDAQPLKPFCRCDEARVLTMLRSFSPEERAEMAEEGGVIRVTCEYCSRAYAFEPATVEG